MSIADEVHIVLLIAKIAGVVFATLHFFAILIVLRQMNLAINNIGTRSRHTLMFLASVHVIILFVIILFILLLPVS